MTDKKLTDYWDIPTLEIQEDSWPHGPYGPFAGVKLVDTARPYDNPATGYRAPVENIRLTTPLIVPMNVFDDDQQDQRYKYITGFAIPRLIKEAAFSVLEERLEELLPAENRRQWLEAAKATVDALPRTELFDNIAFRLASDRLILENAETSSTGAKLVKLAYGYDKEFDEEESDSRRADIARFKMLRPMIDILTVMRHYAAIDDVLNGRSAEITKAPDWWYNKDAYRALVEERAKTAKQEREAAKASPLEQAPS